MFAMSIILYTDLCFYTDFKEIQPHISNWHHTIVLIQWKPCARRSLRPKETWNAGLALGWRHSWRINRELVRSRVTNYEQKWNWRNLTKDVQRAFLVRRISKPNLFLQTMSSGAQLTTLSIHHIDQSRSDLCRGKHSRCLLSRDYKGSRQLPVFSDLCWLL